MSNPNIRMYYQISKVMLPPVFRADVHYLSEGEQLRYMVGIMVGDQQYLAEYGVVFCMRNRRKEVRFRVGHYLNCSF